MAFFIYIRIFIEHSESKRRVLLCLIWVCTVHLCLTKKTLDLYEKSFCLLPYFFVHVRVVQESLMRVIFFLGILRTLACFVSNCSWKNSQFIGIKFTVLPFLPSCWNIRKSILTRMDLDICKVVSQIIGFTCISTRQSSGNNY